MLTAASEPERLMLFELAEVTVSVNVAVLAVPEAGVPVTVTV